jgi:LuxR family maltose regulon positive regulatory protein
VAWGRHLLGQVQRGRGRLDAALQTYQQAREATAGPGRTPLPAAGIGYVGLAEVARQRDELDAALDQVTEGIELCRQLAYVSPLAAGLVTLAWIRQAQGDQAGALEAMREAGRTSQAQAGPLNPVPAQQARLLLAQGDLPAAARWIAERGLQADDDPTTLASRGTWRWPASCSPRASPAGRSRCWTGCTSRRSPRSGPAASSRRAPCAPWPSRPAAGRAKR